VAVCAAYLLVQRWEGGKMAKKVAIIGAGIAGLSVASYLQRNGYDTEIFELHRLPGGLCTSWRRKDYVFDGCIHWLVGCSPSHPLYHLWNEILDMRSLTFIEWELFTKIFIDNENHLIIYSNADALGNEFKRYAPEHGELIDEFVSVFKTVVKLGNNLPKNEEDIALIKKWETVTMESFVKELQNPILEKAVDIYLGKIPILGLFRILAPFHQKSAGYPIGGSLKFSQAIESRYLELGGKIHYDSRVSKIIAQNDKACGLILENGEEIKADLVISAADGHFTVFKMLEKKYINRQIASFYDEENPALKPYASLINISLGVKRTFDKDSPKMVFRATKPIYIDESATATMIPITIYNFDPTLAPEGHTVIIGIFDTTNADYWQDLRRDNSDKYKQEKSRIADEFIDALDDQLGEIKDNVEVIDVATPDTFIRFTNNWKGSYMGWGWGTSVPVQTQRQLPGLENFYMTGQWVSPMGGLPSVLWDGRVTAQMICEKDGKAFLPLYKST
jgi:phytoene dehydrogenase-like protein